MSMASDGYVSKTRAWWWILYLRYREPTVNGCRLEHDAGDNDGGPEDDAESSTPAVVAKGDYGDTGDGADVHHG